MGCVQLENFTTKDGKQVGFIAKVEGDATPETVKAIGEMIGKAHEHFAKKQAFKPRTQLQNKRLHSLIGEFNKLPIGYRIDGGSKAEMVYEITKGRTEHSSEMSEGECAAMIGSLERKIAEIRKHLNIKPPRGHSKRNIQHKMQQANIKRIVTGEHLAELRQWGVNVGFTAEKLIAFNNKQIGKDWPVTTEECNKCIEPLKKMHRRGWRANREAA